jgi:tetratricopeptide (TPR) repeat protein
MIRLRHPLARRREGPAATSPRHMSYPRAAVLSAALILAGSFLACGPGQSPKSQQAGGTAAVSDSAAYQQAGALTDTLGRIGAYKDFLARYPKSDFRQGVYARLYGLMAAKTPDQAGGFFRGQLKTEPDPDARARIYMCLYDDIGDHAPDQVPELLQELSRDKNVSSDAYNALAWDLVDKGKELDEAISLTVLGLEKAADSTSRGEILDTQGWAYFLKGDYPRSVGSLEKAVAQMPEADPQSHLAAAYAKAGQTQKARDLYRSLLLSQENPDWRGAMDELTTQLHGSVEDVAREIDRLRQEHARPMTDFTLKNLDGQEVRLADFKGKVILLNFWHPT